MDAEAEEKLRKEVQYLTRKFRPIVAVCGQT